MSDRWKIQTKTDVYLSPIQQEDRIPAGKLLNDGEIAQNLLIVPFPYSPADFDKFYQMHESQPQQDGYPLNFAVRSSDGLMVGGFGFKELVPGHRSSIGYWLGRPYWGQGIMTSVVRAMTEFAMNEWELVRVSADVFSGNQASARVLEKAGFRFEGLLKKHHKKGDEFKDAKVYAYVAG